MKFSIITPVYESFSLMENYFKSILTQTFNDFEVIIIDDCSKNDCYEEMKNYIDTLNNSRIKLFRTEINIGPGAARNLGIEKAKGEWITFIDNDDWVNSDSLEIVNENLYNNPSDCYVVDYVMEWDTRRITCKSISNASNGYIETDFCLKNIRNHTWGKFYKRESIISQNLRFPELKRCEDIAFTFLAISNCSNIYYINIPLYHYKQRAYSLSNQTSNDEIDILKAYKFIYENNVSKFNYILHEKSINDILYGCVLIMCKTKKNNANIKKFILDYELKNPNWIKSEIISNSRFDKKLFFFLIKYKKIIMLKVYCFFHSLLLH